MTVPQNLSNNFSHDPPLDGGISLQPISNCSNLMEKDEKAQVSKKQCIFRRKKMV